MVPNIVGAVGLSIAEASGGGYDLVVWSRLREGGRMQDVVYRDLSWAELLDVVDEELSGHRPGWAVGSGWRQPPLPFDDDVA